MKRIAIFCDGTWNKLSAPEPTNVVIAARSVLSEADGIRQITYYNEGVGTTHTVFRGLETKFAGAFGLGLLDKIADAYRFLIFNYTPGDEIYIFGFSRGAFTARSLAGLIRKCGILRKEHVGEIGRAFTFYKNPDIRPDRPEADQFRRSYAYDEQQADAAELGRRVAGSPESKGHEPFTIKYVGVWDTVGALGVPDNFRLHDLLGTAERYRFHDHDLSSIVEHARHALALDEDRKAFRASEWKNLEKLSLLPGRAGHYQQKWFPGDHGSVGGGGDVRGLSNEALIWIAEGARAAGLKFADHLLEPYARGCDFLAPLTNTSQRPSLWNSVKDRIMYPRSARQGPSSVEQLSESARNRLNYEVKHYGGKAYQPNAASDIWKSFPEKLE